MTETDACPKCGGTTWSTASDGLGDVASVVAACVGCGYLTTSAVSLAEPAEKDDALTVAVQALNGDSQAGRFVRADWELDFTEDVETVAAIVVSALRRARVIPPAANEGGADD